MEDEDDNGVSNFNFLSLTTWRLGFPDGDIKAEMMSPPRNNFLRSLLRFVVVRSEHNEGIGRIIFRSVFLILRWQKEEGRQEIRSFSTLLAGMLAVVRWAFVLRPFVEYLPVRSSIQSVIQV